MDDKCQLQVGRQMSDLEKILVTSMLTILGALWCL